MNLKNNIKKICHVTSVHPRYDIRIFEKECKSLSKYYDVQLVVADDLGDEIIDGINILDVGKEKNRFRRMFISTWKIYKKIKNIDASVFHLHDPELIPVGLMLKRDGNKVIFDSHEDVSKQILAKPYLNKLLLKSISKIYLIFEKFTCNKFDYIVTATPYIRDNFLRINHNSININNFPKIGELSNQTLWADKKDEICYIGGISINRGIQEIVEAVGILQNIRLNLGGIFIEKETRKKVSSYKGWKKVIELGFIDRVAVSKVLSKSKAGLVTLHPIINYQDALPVKMFEYMIAGIPVISSDILLWKEIVEKNNCGICVNPKKSSEIAKAIKYIIEHPIEAEKMGQNGKKAILNRYNWESEEKKLITIYENILSN
jgi:glycosyltransferase involved in cell wall biosynthesis